MKKLKLFFTMFFATALILASCSNSSSSGSSSSGGNSGSGTGGGSVSSSLADGKYYNKGKTKYVKISGNTATFFVGGVNPLRTEFPYSVSGSTVSFADGYVKARYDSSAKTLTITEAVIDVVSIISKGEVYTLEGASSAGNSGSGGNETPTGTTTTVIYTVMGKSGASYSFYAGHGDSLWANQPNDIYEYQALTSLIKTFSTTTSTNSVWFVMQDGVSVDGKETTVISGVIKDFTPGGTLRVTVTPHTIAYTDGTYSGDYEHYAGKVK